MRLSVPLTRSQSRFNQAGRFRSFLLSFADDDWLKGQGLPAKVEDAARIAIAYWLISEADGASGTYLLPDQASLRWQERLEPVLH